jgi:hypothetical protein
LISIASADARADQLCVWLRDTIGLPAFECAPAEDAECGRSTLAKQMRTMSDDLLTLTVSRGRFGCVAPAGFTGTGPQW